MQLKANDYTRNFDVGILPGDDPTVQQRRGNRCIPQFFTHHQPMEEASAAAGSVRHKAIEMVEFIIPGDKHSVPVRKVKESDKTLYRREYEAFKKGEEMAQDGTPLEVWPMMDRARVRDLKAMNIFTVEQLAGLSDGQMQFVGIGARTLVRHAQAFLETARTGQLPAALVAENEQLKQRMELMTAQMGNLTAKLDKFVKLYGGDASAIADPVADNRAADITVVQKARTVDVPANPASLSFSRLKEVVAQFSVAMPKNKDEALELIAEFQGNVKAAVAA